MDPTAPPGGGKDYYDDEVGISMVGLKSKGMGRFRDFVIAIRRVAHTTGVMRFPGDTRFGPWKAAT